jgi:hypothetical protein
MPVANPVTDSLPPPRMLCRLFLEDGAQVHGVWTGNTWLSENEEVAPTHWAPLANVGMLSRDNGH